MKKLLIIITVFALALSACQDVLEDEYKNPETVNPPEEKSVAGMFSGMLYQWQLFVRDYGEYWWQNSGWGIPAYSQVAHRYITDRYYAYYVDYADVETGVNGFDPSAVVNSFGYHYTKVKEWALMKEKIDAMSEAERDQVEVYYMLATLFKDMLALRSVDFFNSIPYSEALQGNVGILYPKYDDPKEIYVSILTDFKNISENLTVAYNKMNADNKAFFAVQDVALKGDIAKWVQFINALRLQYGIKLAGVDQATGVPLMASALANLPDQDLYFGPYSYEYPSGGGTIIRGMYERTYANFIPNVIMKRMNLNTNTYEPGIDDPRLPVIALPTKFNGNQDYIGVSMDSDTQTPFYNAGNRYYPYGDNIESSLAQNAVSMYNFATYFMNYEKYPAIMMTRAYVDLLLAEIALKNYTSTGKSAAEHMRDAVENSCDWWYMLNGMSGYRTDLAVLHPVKSEADISTYAAKIADDFTAAAGEENKMEIIMQQKYIHVNITDEYDLWSELRRTRHPLLEPLVLRGEMYKPCPERLRYPSSELQLNGENFKAVQDEDDYVSPIFWVPESKRGTVFYLDNVLPLNLPPI